VIASTSDRLVTKHGENYSELVDTHTYICYRKEIYFVIILKLFAVYILNTDKDNIVIMS